MAKKKKTYLVVHKDGVNRFGGFDADHAILQYAKERLGYDYAATIVSGDVQFQKLHDAIKTLPEVRCYELARDEQLRLSPDAMKILHNKMTLVKAMKAKADAEKNKKERAAKDELEVQQKEIELLHMLQAKYPSGHIYDPDDHE